MNQTEMQTLPLDWKPLVARYDPSMVDELMKAAERYMGDRLLEENLDHLFEADEHEIGDWTNPSEEQVRRLVSAGTLHALEEIMGLLGFTVTASKKSCARSVRSLPDFVLSVNNHEALIELEAPRRFNDVEDMIDGKAFRINWTDQGTVGEKVIAKIALCLAARRARWLAFTSHDRWAFFRLHGGCKEPYISYSFVEWQAENTRPFCALLGMLLDTALDLHVPSNVDLRGPVTPASFGPDDGALGEGLLVPETGERSRIADALRTQHRSHLPIHVGWSKHVNPRTEWTLYYPTETIDAYSSFDTSNSPYFRLQRLIARSTTGGVYEARLDADVHGSEAASHSFVIKTATTYNEPDRVDRYRRLCAEFNIYGIIEQARRSTNDCYAVPRCYGLFHGGQSAALITDYVGKPLDEEDDIWVSFPSHVRLAVFNAVRQLHKIGIDHGDIEPRNVVRGEDGKYRIIDFSDSRLHDCPGLIMDSRLHEQEYTGTDRRTNECEELRSLWKQLVWKEPLNVPDIAKRPHGLENLRWKWLIERALRSRSPRLSGSLVPPRLLHSRLHARPRSSFPLSRAPLFVRQILKRSSR